MESRGRDPTTKKRIFRRSSTIKGTNGVQQQKSQESTDSSSSGKKPKEKKGELFVPPIYYALISH